MPVAYPAVAEQIKWNSPSFYYTGLIAPFDPKEYRRDIVVVNLHRGHALLVFATDATIPDPGGCKAPATPPQPDRSSGEGGAAAGRGANLGGAA
ncbi:hypothetical protein [Hymenobacter cellulosivorans]|uniref:Uncharacterized protein n=1 Tax=Hymenobacter cellulosivorans TaxID=2932249 RepID=A0ABY4FBY9_9BACT|nr:hypothetical protein [Hymenobacter cellulosivorans]UOQ53538.1 hypothetical protein MUN80_01980 [Hymenobacter cellulosivorans]